MGPWKVTRVGRVILVVLVAAVAVAFLAPQPASTIGALVAGVIVLFWVMDSFAGGTRGGYAGRIPMPEEERVRLFRRLYRPRRR